MSFEGFYQVICKNGHLHEVLYNYELEPIEYFDCPECGSTAIWLNLVDDTNCEEVDLIEIETDDNNKVTALPDKDQGRWLDQDPWVVITITLEQLVELVKQKTYYINSFSSLNKTEKKSTVDVAVQDNILFVVDAYVSREYQPDNVRIIMTEEETIFISVKNPETEEDDEGFTPVKVVQNSMLTL